MNTESRYAKEIMATKDDDMVKLPIVILVDGQTASASELLTAALMDNGYAKVLGERTYGKGMIQSFMQFDDGTACTISVMEYTTPKGNKIDHVGIMPDLEVMTYGFGSEDLRAIIKSLL